jgi:hypothetical protein
MADRLASMKLGLSIPLHEKNPTEEVVPILNPFRRWRKMIDDYRQEGRNEFEGPQMYICPLNVNTNHFTLLEINEQTKVIHYYDSMASHK